MVSKYVVLIFIQLLDIFAEEKCVSNCENLVLKEDDPCIASADKYPLKRCYENCDVYKKFNNTNSNHIEEEKCLEKCIKLALTKPTSNRKKCRYMPRTCAEEEDKYVKKRCEEYSIFNESTNTNLSNLKAKSLSSKFEINSKPEKYKRETGAYDDYPTNPNQPVNSNYLAQSTFCGRNYNQNPQRPFPQNNYFPTQRPRPKQPQYIKMPFPQNIYYPTERPGPNLEEYLQTTFPENNNYAILIPNCAPNYNQYPTKSPNDMYDYPYYGNAPRGNPNINYPTQYPRISPNNNQYPTISPNDMFNLYSGNAPGGNPNINYPTQDPRNSPNNNQYTTKSPKILKANGPYSDNMFIAPHFYSSKP